MPVLHGFPALQTGCAVCLKFPYSSKLNMLPQNNRGMQKPRCVRWLTNPNQLAGIVDEPHVRE